MANTLLLKKSGQADETPSAGEMSHGELAINYADGKLFFKNSGDSVVEFLSSPGTGAGQVLFSNGSTFTGDSTFFYDDTNNRLGIGTTLPTETLHVEGSASFGGNYIVNEQGRQDHVANTMSSPYYLFDGIDDKITLTYNSNQDDIFANGGSISAWVYPLSSGEANLGSIVWKGDTGAPMVGYDLGFADTDNKLRFTVHWSSGKHELKMNNPSLDYNKWHHVVVTYDGSDTANTATLYINGVEETDVTHSGSPSGSIASDTGYNIVLGEWSDSEQRHWDGLISNINFFIKELSAPEVKSLASGASVPFKYKGASQIELASGNNANFNALGDWTSYAGVTDVGLVSNWSGDSGTGILKIEFGSGKTGARLPGIFEIRKEYRISFDAKQLSGTGATIKIGYQSGTTNSYFEINPTSSQESYSGTLTSEYGQLYVWVQNGDGTEVVLFDDFSVVQIGAIAELDGGGATTNIWYDKSGNDYHGTVSGAIIENKIYTSEFKSVLTDDFLTIDSTLALTINSSSGQIKIGNNAVGQKIIVGGETVVRTEVELNAKNIDINAGTDGAKINSLGVMELDSDDTSHFSMSADDPADKSLTLKAVNDGTGLGKVFTHSDVVTFLVPHIDSSNELQSGLSGSVNWRTPGIGGTDKLSIYADTVDSWINAQNNHLKLYSEGDIHLMADGNEIKFMNTSTDLFFTFNMNTAPLLTINGPDVNGNNFKISNVGTSADVLIQAGGGNINLLSPSGAQVFKFNAEQGKFIVTNVHDNTKDPKITFTDDDTGDDWTIGLDRSEEESDYKVFKIHSSPSLQTTSDFELNTDGDGKFRGNLSCVDATFAGNVLPSADDSKDLGTSLLRWANLYVADAHYSNVGTGGNDVDGTEGSWTIQEGEDDLFLLNRKNGKKYKFKLEAV